MLEWKKLGEVISVHTGSQLNRNDMLEQGVYPVINGGRTPSGYTSEPNEKSNSITISQGGESAGFVNWMDCDFWAGAHCYVVECLDDTIKRYVFHFLKNSEYELMSSKQGAGIPGLNRKNLYKLVIPIPSLSEQTRIVGILDTFTASIENLKQQIAQRCKQYEHYSNNLLKYVEKKESIWKKLSELADIFKGPYITKKDSNEGEFPVIMGGQKVAYYIDRYNSEGESIVISRSGINAGFVSFWNQPIFVSDGYRIDNKKMINKKYLFYFLKNNEDIINSSKKGAGVPHIQSNYLLNFLILVPSLPEQQRIVSILDTFEASIANLEQQLAQRERQYEYYRNKLLTFE